MSSQDSRLAFSVLKHVGEHSDGIAGWRASLGNAGMAGGFTTAGDDGDELCAQALTNITGNSISQGLGVTG